MKTSAGKICGGFTSQVWVCNRGYLCDKGAFVFNLSKSWAPSNIEKAIFISNKGFSFGNGILALFGDELNESDCGMCRVGSDKFYDIQASYTSKSPLTGEKDTFTC